MKVVKYIFGTILALVAIVLIAVLTIPLWIEPVVTGVSNSKVPEITKTGFHMGEFGLSPYTGSLHVGDVQVLNPEKFFKGGTTNAVSWTAIDVDVAMLSLVTDTINIEEISVRDLEIYGDLTFSNIREIADNASGEEEEKVESKKSEVKDEKSEETGKDKADEKKEGGKKVVIDRVVITGTKFRWGQLSVPIPDIEIKDIGKNGDVDGESAAGQIFDAFCAACDKAHAGLGTAFKGAVMGGQAVGKLVGDTVDVIGSGLNNVKSAVTSPGATAADASAAIKDAGKSIAEQSKALGSAGKDAAAAVKDIFKKKKQ